MPRSTYWSVWKRRCQCVSESVREDGRLYTQITLTGALSGLSQDSFMQKG